MSVYLIEDLLTACSVSNLVLPKGASPSGVLQKVEKSRKDALNHKSMSVNIPETLLTARTVSDLALPKDASPAGVLPEVEKSREDALIHAEFPNISDNDLSNHIQNESRSERHLQDISGIIWEENQRHRGGLQDSILKRLSSLPLVTSYSTRLVLSLP